MCKECAFSSYYYKTFEEAIANYYKFKYLIENNTQEVVESYAKAKGLDKFIDGLFRDYESSN